MKSPINLNPNLEPEAKLFIINLITTETVEWPNEKGEVSPKATHKFVNDAQGYTTVERVGFI